MAEEEEQELPQQVQDLAEASVPNSIREIRACKRCGILKTFDQFVSFGMCDKHWAEGKGVFMTRSSLCLRRFVETVESFTHLYSLDGDDSCLDENF